MNIHLHNNWTIPEHYTLSIFIHSLPLPGSLWLSLASPFSLLWMNSLLSFPIEEYIYIVTGMSDKEGQECSEFPMPIRHEWCATHVNLLGITQICVKWFKVKVEGGGGGGAAKVDSIDHGAFFDLHSLLYFKTMRGCGWPWWWCLL